MSIGTPIMSQAEGGRDVGAYPVGVAAGAR
jgi:hypothetical protein